MGLFIHLPLFSPLLRARGDTACFVALVDCAGMQNFCGSLHPHHHCAACLPWLLSLCPILPGRGQHVLIPPLLPSLAGSHCIPLPPHHLPPPASCLQFPFPPACLYLVDFSFLVGLLYTMTVGERRWFGCCLTFYLTLWQPGVADSLRIIEKEEEGRKRRKKKKKKGREFTRVLVCICGIFMAAWRRRRRGAIPLSAGVSASCLRRWFSSSITFYGRLCWFAFLWWHGAFATFFADGFGFLV